MNTFTIQALLRKAKREFVKEKNLRHTEIKLLTQFFIFLLKHEKVNITLINNRFQTIYFRGLIHGFLLAIITYFIIKNF